MTNKALTNLIAKHKNELPYPFDEIAESIGIEKFFTFCECHQGEYLYIPSLKKLAVDIVKAEVRKEFNGVNYKELAVKYGFVERSIRNWVDKR